MGVGKYFICALLIQIAAGQYGPIPAGKTRHRTTTTTETPDTANEVLPPSPYQPPPGYKPPGSPSQPPPPGQQSPSPYPSQPSQPSSPYPSQPSQPSSPYPSQPSQPSSPDPSQPSQPSSPYPSQPSQPSSPYPSQPSQPSSPYPSQPSQPSQPTSQSTPQQPTPSGQPSSLYPSAQPSPQYPTPGSSPYPGYSPSGQPSSQYPTPSGQPTPQQPSPSGQPSSQYPTPSGQPTPQQPSPSGQPAPQYPYPGSGQPTPQQPSPSGQPSSQYPTPGFTQPSSPYPGYSPPVKPSIQLPTPWVQSTQQQPSPNYPPPGQLSPPYPAASGQPQYPTPQSPQPTFPGQTSPAGQPAPQYPQPGSRPSPSQQYWWANGANPFKPAAGPTSPVPATPIAQGPGQPTPSACSPSLSPSPPQPGYGQTATPSQPQPNCQQGPQPQGSFPGSQERPIPQRPAQNPINPNNPFLNNALQNPVRQEAGKETCTTEAAFCVPKFLCNNGIVTDTSSLAPNLNKGPCQPNEVCCKVKKPIAPSPSYPSQPQTSYPGQPQPSYPGQPQPYPGQPQSYAVTESPKYTGPLNTTPYPGCPAALKCVDISYCTAEGVMSPTPVALTREQNENRVPLTECQDMNTGTIGKCCRDPNYKDPWPAGMPMPGMPTNFDDGQYHPPQEQGNEDKLHGTPAPFTPHHTQNQPGYQQPQQPQPSGSVPSAYPPPYQQGAYPQPQQPGYQPQPGNQIQPSQLPYTPTTAGQFPYQPTPSGQYPSNQPQPQQTPYQPQTQQPGPQPSPSQPPYQQQPQPTPVQPSPSQPQQTPYQQQPQPTPVQPQQTPYQPQSQQPGPQPSPSQPSYQPSYPQPTPSGSPQQSTPYNQPTPQAPQPTPGKECGVRRPTQGAQPDEAGFGEFPWHATISSSSNDSALCSAAIIAPNAVITSAHCIEGLNPEDLQIKAGGYTLGQEGPKPAQIREVGAAAIHPSYDSGSLVKDQAVIVTEEPLVLDEHIDKVCLAPSSQDEYEPTGECFVTGYGRPDLQRNTPGTKLHKIKVDLIPKEQCETNLKKTHLGKYFKLNKGFTCAAPIKESELCKVDVGSPLVCQKPDGRYELAGVYSWDTKCSTALPGVMASCDTDWINQVLATPLDKLREQYARPQAPTHLIIDIDTKPGFALGYGK